MQHGFPIVIALPQVGTFEDRPAENSGKFSFKEVGIQDMQESFTRAVRCIQVCPELVEDLQLLETRT